MPVSHWASTSLSVQSPYCTATTTEVSVAHGGGSLRLTPVASLPLAARGGDHTVCVYRRCQWCSACSPPSSRREAQDPAIYHVFSGPTSPDLPRHWLLVCFREGPAGTFALHLALAVSQMALGTHSVTGATCGAAHARFLA